MKKCLTIILKWQNFINKLQLLHNQAHGIKSDTFSSSIKNAYRIFDFFTFTPVLGIWYKQHHIVFGRRYVL